MPKTILVVDDEKDFTDILTSLFNQRRYTAIAANSGPQALEILAKESVDLMTLDMNMPGMNGLEVARAVNQKYPELKIIVVTGFGSDYDEEIPKLKVEGVLDKPVKIPELLNKVKELIGTP